MSAIIAPQDKIYVDAPGERRIIQVLLKDLKYVILASTYKAMIITHTCCILKMGRQKKCVQLVC